MRNTAVIILGLLLYSTERKSFMVTQAQFISMEE